MSNREFFITRWEAEQPAFTKVLRAIPEGQLRYKPHERSSAAGALAWQLLLSLLFGAYLVRRSLEQSAFDGLRRQVALLADEQVHPPAGSFGRFLATQDERLSVLPRKQARLLVPDRPTGRITINGHKYLYASKSTDSDVVVLLRTASSVRAENHPFWIALAAAGFLGCILAA